MRKVLPMVILIQVLLLAAAGFGGSGKLLLNVQTEPSPWGEPRIYEKLETLLSRDGRFEIVPADNRSGMFPTFPEARNNVDSMVNWGQEAGGRYLLTVTVDSERLERKKTFNLPLIFHKWETVGIIEGEVRLYDVPRGKQLMAEPFRVELTGPRAFQATPDDNKHDPSLNLSAVQKLTFFGDLEQKLADRLTTRTFEALRNR